MTQRRVEAPQAAEARQDIQEEIYTVLATTPPSALRIPQPIQSHKNLIYYTVKDPQTALALLKPLLTSFSLQRAAQPPLLH